MKIAFYKKDGPGATFVDKLICWWTNGSYSHVELIINDNVFYSCSPRDQEVRYKEIDPDMNNWDIYNVCVPLDENKMRKHMDVQVGRKYDWVGLVFGQVFNYKDVENPSKWFCSELCSYILQQGGMDISEPYCSYNPSGLYEYLESKNYVNKS